MQIGATCSAEVGSVVVQKGSGRRCGERAGRWWWTIADEREERYKYVYWYVRYLMGAEQAAFSKCP